MSDDEPETCTDSVIDYDPACAGGVSPVDTLSLNNSIEYHTCLFNMSCSDDTAVSIEYHDMSFIDDLNFNASSCCLYHSYISENSFTYQDDPNVTMGNLPTSTNFCDWQGFYYDDALSELLIGSTLEDDDHFLARCNITKPVNTLAVCTDAIVNNSLENLDIDTNMFDLSLKQYNNIYSLAFVDDIVDSDSKAFDSVVNRHVIPSEGPSPLTWCAGGDTHMETIDTKRSCLCNSDCIYTGII